MVRKSAEVAVAAVALDKMLTHTGLARLHRSALLDGSRLGNNCPHSPPVDHSAIERRGLGGCLRRVEFNKRNAAMAERISNAGQTASKTFAPQYPWACEYPQLPHSP